MSAETSGPDAKPEQLGDRDVGIERKEEKSSGLEAHQITSTWQLINDGQRRTVTKSPTLANPSGPAPV
jgi:hypothetical protein